MKAEEVAGVSPSLWSLAWLSVACCLVFSGCVATREDVAGLEVQVARLEKSVTALEKRQVELSSQLDAIKAPVMSLNSNLDDTQAQLTNFNPRFEEIRSSLDGIKKDLIQKIADIHSRLENMGTEIQAKLSEIRKSQTTAPPPKSNAHTKTGKDSSKKNDADANLADGPSGGSPLGAFQNAYKDFLAERWQLAQSGFANYLKSEPKGSLADKSLYYWALSAKALKNNKEALSQFEDILKRFPKSPVARAAMLEKAKIQLADNQQTEAEGMLEYLIITFPKSQEAQEAKELLKKLPGSSSHK